MFGLIAAGIGTVVSAISTAALGTTAMGTVFAATVATAGSIGALDVAAGTIATVAAAKTAIDVATGSGTTAAIATGSALAKTIETAAKSSAVEKAAATIGGIIVEDPGPKLPDPVDVLKEVAVDACCRAIDACTGGSNNECIVYAVPNEAEPAEDMTAEMGAEDVAEAIDAASDDEIAEVIDDMLGGRADV